MIIIAKKKKDYIEIKGKKYAIDPKIKRKIRENINQLKKAERIMEVPSLKKRILSGQKITNKEAKKEIQKEIVRLQHKKKLAENKERKYKNVLRSMKR